jgi:hypothetical protein
MATSKLGKNANRRRRTEAGSHKQAVLGRDASAPFPLHLCSTSGYGRCKPNRRFGEHYNRIGCAALAINELDLYEAFHKNLLS